MGGVNYTVPVETILSKINTAKVSSPQKFYRAVQCYVEYFSCLQQQQDFCLNQQCTHGAYNFVFPE